MTDAEAPTEEQVDHALSELVRQVQLFGPEHHVIPDGYLSRREALSILFKHLKLPQTCYETFVATDDLSSWENVAKSLTGALFDAVCLRRSLSDSEAESYLKFLHYSFTLDGYYRALSSLNPHYLKALRERIEPPDFEEELKKWDSVNPQECNLVLRCIAMDRNQLTRRRDLKEYTNEIVSALLLNDHAFFRCLPDALYWEPPEKRLSPAEFAALPQSGHATSRPLARRYWVSRGLWMLDSKRVGRVFPDLGGGVINLTAPSKDSLYSEQIYTDVATIEKTLRSHTEAPEIAVSILSCTC